MSALYEVRMHKTPHSDCLLKRFYFILVIFTDKLTDFIKSEFFLVNVSRTLTKEIIGYTIVP